MGEPDAIEPLRIDAELWSHRDLLERIIGRWVQDELRRGAG